MVSASVEKLNALLERVRRNRALPREEPASLAAAIASPVSHEAQAAVAAAPVSASQRPSSPVVATASAPPPAAASTASAPPAPPAAERPAAALPEGPISEVRNLSDVPPAPERKKPAPSPLELAVGSSVERQGGPSTAPPAAADASELEIEPAALASEPAPAQVALEPEPLVAAPLSASGPVVTAHAAFAPEKPKTFGELLERTLSLQVR
jgi:hypothetical protein